MLQSREQGTLVLWGAEIAAEATGYSGSSTRSVGVGGGGWAIGGGRAAVIDVVAGCSGSQPHIQVVQVNSVSLERNEIICLINKCCGVVDKRGVQLKTSLFDHAMRATSISLNAAVTPPVKERLYSNLLTWFRNLRAFLLEKDFSREGGDGDVLIFDEGMLH